MPANVNPAAQDGPVVITHTPEAAQAYQDAAAAVRRRQLSGMAPESTQAAQVPQAAPAGRVDAGLAGRVRDRRVHALRADLMRFGKESQRPQIGMGGMQIPGAADRQRQVLMAVEATQAEIERLSALEGQALIDWAMASGLIRFTQSGNVVL